jgi:hypothetical protein
MDFFEIGVHEYNGGVKPFFHYYDECNALLYKNCGVMTFFHVKNMSKIAKTAKRKY